MGWNPADLPDAHGRTVAITGANAGVGYFTAEQLARAGARVVLACRDPERAEAAVAAIRRRVPGARVQAVPLDVADRRSVDAAAESLLALDRLDARLVRNRQADGLTLWRQNGGGKKYH